jgi:drug/metabolite transporter (DMT)-like permease
MAVLLALGSAATYGVGDFLGGLAAKRAAATAVLLWSHVFGLALALGTTFLVHGVATTHDVGLGAIGGLAGAVGIGLLYQALSIGQMSAVAPVTALLAAVVPVAAGLLQGERPTATAVLGMVCGAAAIVLVSAEGGGSLRPADRHAVTLALGAGFGFGLFFVILSHTGDGAGAWPLVGARLASVGAVGGLALLGRVPASVPAGPARRLTVAAGAFDVGANLLYLLATREGLLTIVSVLASLYPVSTVVLAWVVLRERFAPIQRVGLLLALPAAILMSQ